MTLLFDPDKPIIATRNDMLESRRFGHLYYSKHLLETAPEAIRKLYTKIVPTEIRYDFAREIFDVIALCEDFDPVEPGYVIPYYAVHIQVQKRDKGTGKAYYLFFEKLETE